LGDTVKNMEKRIATRNAKVASLKAEMTQLQEDITKLIEKGQDESQALKTKKLRADKIPGEIIVNQQEAKILTDRCNEYKSEKAKLKQELTNKTITKEKYQKAKARLQAVLKFAVEK
jgi:chromosome segregation ATPase